MPAPTLISPVADDAAAGGAPAPYPLDRWYVAGLAWELTDQPLARTLLDQPLVLFRTPDGRAAALQDRCCHRQLPLSCGRVEAGGLRCGYHGLLFDAAGRCTEIPGQARVPPQAGVPAYPLQEQDRILWVWMARTPGTAPTCAPPRYPVHDDARYRVGGDVIHYQAPYQLLHDNLLDLSHLGFVHLKTIGGDPAVHTSAQMTVTSEGECVRVRRRMPGSEPPPAYRLAWPLAERVDRWQEIEFHVSHLHIWSGAMDAGTGDLDDPQRGGFHVRGFHGVTPETRDTSHYFWTIATNRHPARDDVGPRVLAQSRITFLEDKQVIEAQHANQRRFGPAAGGGRDIDIASDAAPNRARRVVEQLLRAQARPQAGLDRSP